MAFNLFKPCNLRPTVEVTALTLTAVSTIVVLARFYCRIWIVGKLKVYDFFIAAAVLSVWALCVVNHFQFVYRTGEGLCPDLSPKMTITERKGSVRIWYIYQTMYPIVPALVKISILIFYLSIAAHRIFRVIVKMTIIFICLFATSIVLMNAFSCPSNPRLALNENIFNMRNRWGCIDLTYVYFTHAGINIFLDTFIWILPLPILVRLRMDRCRRIGLLLLFSIGILVPVAVSFRMWALWSWSHSGHLGRYYGGYILFWDQIEMNTAIICASAPSLQPLLQRAFGGLLSRFQRDGDTYYYYGAHSHSPSTLTHRSGQRMDVPLRTPAATYRARKEDDIGPPGEVLGGVVRITEAMVKSEEDDAEEKLRQRVRAFTFRSISPNSQPPISPISPARPRDLLSPG